MRILLINPNTTESMTREIHEAAVSVAAAGTEIVSVTSPIGANTLECIQEELCASIGVMQLIHEAELNDPPDAYIIGCYGDPALDAAREITDKPVIGIAQASMYMAAQIAAKFSIITDPPSCFVAMEQLVAKYGMQDYLASVRGTPLTIEEYEEDYERSLLEMTKAARRAVEEDRAEAICLGCAGMVSFTKQLQEDLGVPVIDGVVAAVKMAEGFVTLGLGTSKICTYEYPPKKQYQGVPEVIRGGRSAT